MPLSDRRHGKNKFSKDMDDIDYNTYYTNENSNPNIFQRISTPAP